MTVLWLDKSAFPYALIHAFKLLGPLSLKITPASKSYSMLVTLSKCFWQFCFQNKSNGSEYCKLTAFQVNSSQLFKTSVTILAKWQN